MTDDVRAGFGAYRCGCGWTIRVTPTDEIGACAIRGCREHTRRDLAQTRLCRTHLDLLRLEFLPSVFATYPPHEWLRASVDYAAAFGEPTRKPDWIDRNEALYNQTPAHDPIVYFAMWGDRCKIGTTTNLPSRAASLSLPLSAFVHREPGGVDEEHGWHARFAEYRIEQTEWFYLAGDLWAFLQQAAA